MDSDDVEDPWDVTEAESGMQDHPLKLLVAVAIAMMVAALCFAALIFLGFR